MSSSEGLPTVVGDRYRLVDLLGRGGTAEVHLAHDEVLGRDVALKLLPRGHGEDDVVRMEAEMRTLARLNHPALVSVHDAGADDGRPWFVMELVAGTTLSDRLRRGPLELDQVAALAVRLTDALSAVHDAGVVHRDVKPGNVLLPDGQVDRAKLADFGVARVLDSAALTATGLVVGTAAYLAPEQVTGEDVTSAADVYALGLVLLECVTGEREFPGTGVESAAARLHRAPRVPGRLPRRLGHLLTWMLRDEPERRPSVAEVRRRAADHRLLSEEAVDPSARTTVLTPVAAGADDVDARGDRDRPAASAGSGATQTGDRRTSSPPRAAEEAGDGTGPRARTDPLVLTIGALLVVILVLVGLLLSTAGRDLGPLNEPLQRLEQEVGLR